MTSRYDTLIEASDQIAERALAVDNATEQLARAANGNQEHVIPAPTAYRVLGELKSTASNLAEVTGYLPTGLRRSLTEPGIQVHDYHFTTGEPRDPATQVELAAGHLAGATAALRQLAEHLEAAQTALNSQGFTQLTAPLVPALRPPLRAQHRANPPKPWVSPATRGGGPSL